MRHLAWWMLIVTAVLAVTEVDARPRRPRKQVDHYTYNPDRVTDRIAPYRDAYDRIVLEHTSRTRVTEGAPICRLQWTGRRVDYFTGAHSRDATFVFRRPRSADMSSLNVYLVDRNGKDAEKLEDVSATVGDSLIVVALDIEPPCVVDLQYELTGVGVSVDESFEFQPQWPVLREEYRFSVSRELWQKAADEGLAWEFSASSTPRTWEPKRADTTDFFTWYWAESNVEPLPAGEPASRAKTVTVEGYLPAPALAGIDPDELPQLESLTEILMLEERLIDTYEEREREFGGPGGVSESSTGSGGASLPPRVGK